MGSTRILFSIHYGFYEYACHEGNYTMFYILSGARAQENAATGK